MRQHICLLEVLAHRIAQIIKAARFCLGSIVASTAAGQTVQREHINRELWLYIAADLLVQCELELYDNLYTIVQRVPSFTQLHELCPFRTACKHADLYQAVCSVSLLSRTELGRLQRVQTQHKL